MTAIWRNTLTLVGATTLTFGMAHAQSPELSDPPEIEGEVVDDHGSHTLRMGIGLAESSPQFLSTSNSLRLSTCRSCCLAVKPR